MQTNFIHKNKLGKINTGLCVVLGLCVVSLGLGGLAYRQFVQSERSLSQGLDEFRLVGARADVEGCVDSVMRWRESCAALAPLCDGKIPDVLKSCLESQNRQKYCISLGESSSNTHFGYQACKDRGLSKHAKKGCAIAYRVIDAYCKQLAAQEPLETTSLTQPQVE